MRFEIAQLPPWACSPDRLARTAKSDADQERKHSPLELQQESRSGLSDIVATCSTGRSTRTVASSPTCRIYFTMGDKDELGLNEPAVAFDAQLTAAGIDHSAD